MTIKRIYLMALFLFLADFFVACCHCDPQTIEYKRCELNVSNLKYTDEGYENLFADSVLAKDFGIQLLFEENENICQLKATGLFVNSAMACNCEDTYGKALDRYQSIEIFTIQSFDSIHPAGSNVSEYFRITNFPETSILTEYVAFANDENTTNSYFGTEIVSTILAINPQYSGQHQFKVEATMTDGRVLSEVSSPVALY